MCVSYSVLRVFNHVFTVRLSVRVRRKALLSVVQHSDLPFSFARPSLLCNWGQRSWGQPGYADPRANLQ